MGFVLVGVFLVDGFFVAVTMAAGDATAAKALGHFFVVGRQGGGQRQTIIIIVVIVARGPATQGDQVRIM